MTGNRVDILIAEDEAIVALELKQLLSRNDFNVVAVVKSGEDLINESKKLHPDIIVTDIQLKGMLNGIEAVKKINRKTAKIPIIFVTGFSDEFTHKNALTAYPKAYLLKPFNEDTLINSIKNCIINNYS